jgi:hypothetical protein
MRSFHLLVAAFALLQFVRYARGAALFLFPNVRVRAAPGAPPPSAARLRAGAALEALGFVPIGVIEERGPLGTLARDSDAYASAARGVFADVLQEGAGAPRVQFVTPFDDGAAVLTAAFRRRGVVTDRVQAGGMPDAPLAAVLAAHEKGVARLAANHGRPAVAEDVEARAAAARAWYGGEGRRELRRAHLLAFGVAALGIALFASAAHVLLRAQPGR